MLTSEHADVLIYRKDPEAFVIDLYKKIKGVYSSLYSDKLEDVAVALKRLDGALHEGFTSEQLLFKAAQARDLTDVQYRSSCAKLVRDYYWSRSYLKPSKLEKISAPKPYAGPMPSRP